jgi:uncharacterized delta-60 repeat protein
MYRSLVIGMCCALSLTSLAQQFDPSFNPILKSLPTILSIDETSNGNFVVAGNFDFIGDEPAGSLLMLDRNGILVQGFNKVYTDFPIKKVKVLSDDKILIMGSFTRVNGVNSITLARLHADGSLDESFQSSLTTGMNDFVLQSDEKIVMSPEYPATKLTRLNSDGSKDNSFSQISNGLGVIFQLSVDSDDNIYVANTYQIKRFVKNGLLDETFSTNPGIKSDSWTEQIHVIEADPNGKLLVGGTFKEYNGSAKNGLVRLNNDGTIDATFLGNPLSEGITKILVTRSQDILIAGNNFAVTKFSADGTTRTEIAFPYPSSVNCLFETSSSDLLIAGDYFQINGTNQHSLSLLKSGYSIDPDFKPEIYSSPTSYSSALDITHEGNLIVAGFDQEISSVGNSTKPLVKINKDGTIDDSFVTEFEPGTRILTVAVQNDQRILVSGFLFVNGKIHNLLRVNSDGTIDKTFNSNKEGLIGVAQKIRFNGSEIFLGGNFDTYNGIHSQSFIILKKDGSIKQTFPDIPEATIVDFDFQSDGKIIAIGAFYPSNDVFGYLRLKQNGTVDETFPTGKFDNYFVVKVDQDDRIYLGGDLATRQPEKVIRLLKDGTLDNSFLGIHNFSGQSSSLVTVRGIDILPSKELVLMGNFSKYNNEEVNGLVILKKDESGYTSVNSLGRSSVITSLKYHGASIFVGGKVSLNDGQQVMSFAKLTLDKEKMFEPNEPMARIIETNAGEATLRWNDLSDAEDGYQIERFNEVTAAYEFVDDVADDHTAYILSDFTSVAPNSYRIRSYNSKGESEYSYFTKSEEVITNLEEKFENAIKAYPNPTDGILILSGNFNEEPIIVTNSMGQIVLNGSKRVDLQGKTMLDLNELPKGVYWISFGSPAIQSIKVFKK